MKLSNLTQKTRKTIRRVTTINRAQRRRRNEISFLLETQRSYSEKRDQNKESEIMATVMQEGGGGRRVQKAATPHFPPVPIVSRLDHLDSLMKFLEGKQNSQKCLNGGGTADTAKLQQNAALMEVAMKEAYFKGSLLDRVASLEHRLFQLCMEMESTSTSASSSGGCTTTTTTDTTVMGFRSQTLSSLPAFSLPNPRQPLLHHTARSHLQQVEEEKEEEDQEAKDAKRKDSKKVGKCSSSSSSSKTKTEENNKCRSNATGNNNNNNNKKQLSWAKIRPLKLLGC
ncbi:hypothetical protein LINPERPRIM_LOCUS44085 [Linum perenne]